MKMKTLLALSLVALPLAVPSLTRAGQIELIDRLPVRSRPDTAAEASAAWQISTDGRYLLFVSSAANLIAGQRDTNRIGDVFLYDRTTGTTTLVTHKAGDVLTAANGGLFDESRPQMTPDGRYVAYESFATDLVAGTANAGLFLYDRVTGTTTFINHKAGSPLERSNGALVAGPFGLAADGSVVFVSDASDLVASTNDFTGNADVFFWDRTSGKTSLITRAAGTSAQAADSSSAVPGVSADGRFVTFSSSASNLVSGAHLTGYNVFLHDRATGKTVLVSHASSSLSAPADSVSEGALVSSGGTWVLFSSFATNLVPGQKDKPTTSDLFLYERATGKITLVSHAKSSRTTAGDAGSGGYLSGYLMTPDGAWIAFTSDARNLVAGQPETDGFDTSDVFLYERATGTVTLASRTVSATSPAGGICRLQGLSADGRKVAFSSWSDTLAASGTDVNEARDVFLFDRATGKVSLVSAVAGTAGNAASPASVLSADGRWVGYSSEASDLAVGRRDTNGAADVFLYEAATAQTRPVTLHGPRSPSIAPPAGGSGAGVSADGRFVVFTSAATNLVPGESDINGKDDAYLYDRTLRKTTLVSRSEVSPTITGNGEASDVRISADGRFVTYLSTSTDAVPGQEDVDDRGRFDLFLFEPATGTTTLVTHAAGSPTRTGNHASGLWAEMSADATWIAYAGLATDLVVGQVEPYSPYDRNAFLYNRLTGETTLLSHRHDSHLQPANAETIVSAISADGQVVLLRSRASDLIPPIAPDLDTNGNDDVFVVDRGTGITTLVSRTTDNPPRAAGAQYARMSRDGRMVSFVSEGKNLVPGQVDGDRTGDLFLHDRQSGTTALVSHAAGSAVTAVGAFGMALSGGGRWLAFTSAATDVVAGQTDANARDDAFLYDRDTGTTRMVSHTAGSPSAAAGVSNLASISDDGRYVAFLSRATDLVPGLITPVYPPDNIYVHDRATGANTLVTRSAVFPDRCGNADSVWPVMVTASGNGVMFTSEASDLVTGDFTSTPDVFLYTLP
jgi:Tol biopolymer transport system component